MNVIDELYVLRDDPGYIVYAPLLRVLARVNWGTVALLKNIRNGVPVEESGETGRVIGRLRGLGIIVDGEQLSEHSRGPSVYSPTSVTFLPTSECNLRCVYCYANSGDKPGQTLVAAVGKRAIDRICENAVTRGQPTIQVGFLGGGEPFLAWPFVVEIYDYAIGRAKAMGLSAFFSGVTNGVLPTEKVHWLREHFNFLNVSLDGPKEIQDTQRPTKSGKGSYDVVRSTLQVLNATAFDYAVRVTVSRWTVDSMPEIVRFLSQEIAVRKIHLEPIFQCGRCRYNKDLVPSPMAFANGFKACLAVVDPRKTEILCSFARLYTLSSTYCGALVENFYITPDAYITACTEVSSPDDERSGVFFVGRYDEDHNDFVLWNDRIEALSRRTGLSMRDCRGCISKWHCAGGCPAKADACDICGSVDTYGCTITREVTEYYLRQLSNGSLGRLPRINPRAVENTNKP